MRAFNQLVFDGQVSGLAAVSTKDEVADLLGKADDLVLEVEVESSTGTLPTITLDAFHCNSGKVYQAATDGTIITAESIATAPYRKIALYAKTSATGDHPDLERGPTAVVLVRLAASLVGFGDKVNAPRLASFLLAWATPMMACSARGGESDGDSARSPSVEADGSASSAPRIATFTSARYDSGDAVATVVTSEKYDRVWGVDVVEGGEPDGLPGVLFFGAARNSGHPTPLASFLPTPTGQVEADQATVLLLSSDLSSDRFTFGAASRDLTGDGLADLVMTRLTTPPILVFSAPFDLAEPASFEDRAGSITGPGYARGVPADLDGDGMGDIVVEAKFEDSPYGVSGVHGPVAGDLDVMDFDWRRTYTYQSGISILATDDVQGDGYADVLLAVPGDWGHETLDPLDDAGAVYVFHGPLQGDGDFTTADAVIYGESSEKMDSLFGPASVASPGDTDGDGVHDLAIGAVLYPGTVGAPGGVYIAHGPFEGTRMLADEPTRWIGTEGSSYVGVSLAPAGDTDGDGRAELWVGSESWNQQGAVWRVGDPGPGEHSLRTADVVITGGDRFGRSVVAGRDANGDGREDLLVLGGDSAFLFSLP